MIETLKFHQVNNVVETWMHLQAVPNFPEEAGEILFHKCVIVVFVE